MEPDPGPGPRQPGRLERRPQPQELPRRGAAVYFFCHFDEGRYRADFVEMLRDAYHGGARAGDVEAYFNLPVPVLDAMMRRFYEAEAR